MYQILPIAHSVAAIPPMPGNAIYCEEFGHKLQPKSPSAKLGKLSLFDFLASCVGIAPFWGNGNAFVCRNLGDRNQYLLAPAD